MNGDILCFIKITERDDDRYLQEVEINKKDADYLPEDDKFWLRREYERAEDGFGQILGAFFV